MSITRRRLLYLLLVRPPQSTSIQMRVLEAFTSDGNTRAILVNHASESSRDGFAQWLQKNPRANIRIRRTTGEETAATIFRVRMCFGRGLILLNQPIKIAEGEVLTADEAAMPEKKRGHQLHRDKTFRRAGPSLRSQTVRQEKRPAPSNEPPQTSGLTS